MTSSRRSLLCALSAALFGAGCEGQVLLDVDCPGDPTGAACAAADPCAASTCSPHGRCVVDSGVAACTCDSGYEPLDLTCAPVDLCKGIDCGAHGHCAAPAGVAACTCDSGFEPSGLTCIAVDPCQGVDCGAHGHCAASSGAAACACDSGFEPSGLTCVAIDPCKGVQCGTGAHCDAAACVCDTGLTGDPKVECTAPTSRELAVRAKLVQIAEAEVGMCEGVDQRPYMEGQPGLWCYDFVAWVYAQANEGLGQPLYLPQRQPQSLPNWRPKAGDLIKYTYQHYAMVKDVVGDTVYTVEGNVNSCVMERSTSYADVEYYGTLETSF